MQPNRRTVQKIGGGGILIYSKHSWNLNTMLGLNNIQSPLRYGVRNIKNAIECQFVCDCPYKRHSPSFLMFLRTSHFKYPLHFNYPLKYSM